MDSMNSDFYQVKLIHLATCEVKWVRVMAINANHAVRRVLGLYDASEAMKWCGNAAREDEVVVTYTCNDSHTGKIDLAFLRHQKGDEWANSLMKYGTNQDERMTYKISK